MRLYLARHGEANHPEMDPERGLTEQGRREVEKVASLMGKMKITVDTVWESGKKRATQTAEILASSIDAAYGIERRSGLSPMDPVSPVADHLASLDSNLLIVGHLPFLERLTSYLVTGSQDKNVLKFQNGGIVCLDIDPETDSWMIKWTLMPNIG